MTLPSKELLSEVLDIDIYNINGISSTEIEYEYDMKEFGEHLDIINIYELSFKFKEWAYQNNYSIRTFRTSIGWVVDTLHNNIEDGRRKNTWVFDIINYDNDTMHQYHFETEVEAVLAVCEWILQQKKDNK